MDREAFRERFKAYKKGKPVSEIYDAGLPKYLGGKGPQIIRKSTADQNLVSFDLNRRIKLTNAGLATGAVLSESLLDAIAEAAYRRGLPIKTALGLATKESTLGNPTDDTSVYKILSPEKVEYFKSLGTGTHINNTGDALLMQDVVNYHRPDNYPEDWNTFDRAFLFYKDTPHKYNPGQKNHPQLVDKRGEEVWNSPEILKWYKNWEASKILVNRPEEYKINTNLLNTATKPFFKNGKLPGFRIGKEDDDPFEIKKQGKLISAAVNRNVYGNKTELNKKHDEVIAKKKAYGWKNAMRTPIHNARQAAELINPAWGFHDIIPALWSRFVSPTDMKGSTPDDKAFWKRHIGFERDLESMPITGIRFSGDYNDDGSLRLPEAEYTGLSKLAKDFIRAGIENRKLIPKRNGVWTQVHENGLNPGTTRFNPYSKYTSHLGDYSIRENNDSGIYDVVDTYDFPMLYPVFNRQNGKQIEIRDTIHTKNAVPELYDPMFSATFPKYSNGKSIHINPANRGKFNATKKRTGKTTEELTHSSNPLTRKRAIFALNARKWHHK